MLEQGAAAAHREAQGAAWHGGVRRHDQCLDRVGIRIARRDLWMSSVLTGGRRHPAREHAQEGGEYGGLNGSTLVQWAGRDPVSHARVRRSRNRRRLSTAAVRRCHVRASEP